MKGELITDACEILRLSKEGKSVFVTHWNRTSPAAFLINWTLKDIGQLIENKCLFYYTPSK